MKISVVDDIQSDRELLSDMVKEPFIKAGYPIDRIEPFASGEDFLKQFEAGKYDVIFLDIYMKELSGIETAKKIRALDREVKLVFITSSNDFASESYAVRADGYILKPYGEDELIQIVSRLHLSSAESKRILTLPDGQAVKLFSILYTSFSGHYVSIYLTNGKFIKTRMTQSAFAQLLFAYPGFLSCNPGMIVSLREVDELDSDRFVLSNGTHIPISRRRYPEVKKAYTDYLIGQMRKGENR